eukprot:scaffold674188_cov61-Prasinocladus_malaysianus.AAC.1
MFFIAYLHQASSELPTSNSIKERYLTDTCSINTLMFYFIVAIKDPKEIWDPDEVDEAVEDFIEDGRTCPV